MIPFDLLLQTGAVNQIIRFTRIGKLYRFMKFLKMMRVLKVMQVRNTIIKKMSEKLKVGIGIERLTFLSLVFFVLLHSTTCIW